VLGCRDAGVHAIQMITCIGAHTSERTCLTTTLLTLSSWGKREDQLLPSRSIS
jgi:hypothetical protein